METGSQSIGGAGGGRRRGSGAPPLCAEHAQQGAHGLAAFAFKFGKALQRTGHGPSRRHLPFSAHAYQQLSCKHCLCGTRDVPDSVTKESRSTDDCLRCLTPQLQELWVVDKPSSESHRLHRPYLATSTSLASSVSLRPWAGLALSWLRRPKGARPSASFASENCARWGWVDVGVRYGMRHVGGAGVGGFGGSLTRLVRSPA